MLENFENVKEVAANAIKEGIEKTTANLAEVTSQGQANLDAIVQSSQLFGKGAGEVAAIATAHTKAAFERGVEVVKNFGTVKSLQEAVELQSDFAKTAVSNWVEDFNKISEILTSTSKEAVKPVSDRATEVLSKMKVAAQ